MYNLHIIFIEIWTPERSAVDLVDNWTQSAELELNDSNILYIP